MFDLQQVRDLRQKIREVIGFKDGAPITNEQLSATMAVLAEVWTMRIYCSPEKHTTLGTVALFQRITGDLAALMQKQAAELLPHSKTVSFFNVNPTRGGQQ